MATGQRQQTDVADGILLYLPVKSLKRFTCVSKSWCTLIKSPRFVNDHLLKWRKNRSILLVRRQLALPPNDDVLSFHNIHSADLNEVWPSLSIPFLKDLRFKYDYPYWAPGLRLLGPCSGLICIAYSDDCIIFCNPALREFTRLPPCPYTCPVGYYVSPLGNGFGNTRANDFKVVLIQETRPQDFHADQPYTTVHLYSSSTNCWRQIDDRAIGIPYISYVPCSEIFFNGSCHWNADTNGPNITDSILTFNVSNETFTMFEYPDCLKDLDDNQSCLMVLNELLGLVRYSEYELTEEPRHIEVWVMREYGIKESWTKQFLVGPHIIVCPFLFWKNNEQLLVECRHGELASCALHTSDIQKFEVNGAEATLRALIYEESLISLNKVILFSATDSNPI